MLKAKKQKEAQLKAKKDREERLKQREEELRLQEERAALLQREKEKAAAAATAQRLAEEAVLRKEQFAVTIQLLSQLRHQLQRETLAKNELKDFNRCMRTDGLPDPSQVPQLHTFRHRWLENSPESSTTTLPRLLERTSEFVQVIRDVDELLEDPQDLRPPTVLEISHLRSSLVTMFSEEISRTVWDVLCDVMPHFQNDDTFLDIQTSTLAFALGLGSDTARNSQQKTYEFKQSLGIKLDLPSQVLATSEEPVVVFVLWQQQAHTWDAPQNTVLSLNNMLLVEKSDLLYDFVEVDSEISSPFDNLAQKLTPYEESDLDVKQFTLVAGVWHIRLLQLPPQPKRYAHWTISRINEGENLQFIQFRAQFKPPPDTDPDAEQRQDPEDMDREARLQEQELEKLISVTIKLPNFALWLEPPKPVRWDVHRQCWSSKGVWDIRFNEEIGGPTIQFRLEEPSVVALAQSRRVNLPLQNWSLKAGLHRLTAIIKSKPIEKPTVKLKTVKKTEDEAEGEPAKKWRGGGGAGGGGGWDGAGPDGGSSSEEEEELEVTPAILDEAITPDKVDYSAVLLTLAGSLVSVDIDITAGGVALRQVRSSTQASLHDLLNVTMPPLDFFRVMDKRGIDLLPTKEVCSHVEELPNKHLPTERHLYRCIALAAAGGQRSFGWSRWNLMAGEDNFVFQMQHTEDKVPNQLVQATSERVRILECADPNQNVEEQEFLQGEHTFHADLLNALLNGSESEINRENLLNPNPALVGTIYTILAATCPLSTA